MVCEYCGREGHIESDGTFIHDTGPCRNSFICHRGPDEVVPFEDCDCWACERNDPDAGDHLMSFTAEEGHMALLEVERILEEDKDDNTPDEG
jgi:hypothetical protein